MSTSPIFTIEITMTFHFSIISIFIIFLHIYNMLYFFHNSFSSFGSSIIFKCSIYVNSKSIKYHPICLLIQFMILLLKLHYGNYKGFIYGIKNKIITCRLFKQIVLAMRPPSDISVMFSFFMCLSISLPASFE